MSIKNIIDQERNVQIVVNAADLKELFLEWINEKDSQIQAVKEEDQYLSPNETVSILRISKPTLWRWEKHGFLVPVKIAGKKYYRKSEVDALLQSH